MLAPSQGRSPSQAPRCWRRVVRIRRAEQRTKRAWVVSRLGRSRLSPNFLLFSLSSENLHRSDRSEREGKIHRAGWKLGTLQIERRPTVGVAGRVHRERRVGQQIVRSSAPPREKGCEGLQNKDSESLKALDERLEPCFSSSFTRRELDAWSVHSSHLERLEGRR